MKSIRCCPFLFDALCRLYLLCLFFPFNSKHSVHQSKPLYYTDYSVGGLYIIIDYICWIVFLRGGDFDPQIASKYL